MPRNSKTQIVNQEPEKEYLLWKYLNQDDMNRLDTSDPILVENYLAQKFNLNDYEIDLKQACFLDFYVTQYWWAAKEKGFNHEQASSYFSLIYNLMDNLKERHLSHSANIEEFKTILGELNEKSKLFSDDQLKEIISHLLITFFQNNRLFEFVINEPQAEVSITKEIEVECPKPPNLPYPAPLDEAMPENQFNKYILKIPDEPTPEELERLELEKPENIQVPDKVIEQIHSKFDGLSLEEAKRIIFEVTNELVTDLKVDMRTKIKERESVLLNELTKNQTKNAKK